MTKVMTPETTLFESIYCGRCGGNGRYGPLSVEGGRCFKCHGQGVVLTKRGAAASVLYHDSLKVKASTLIEGEKILVDGVPGIEPTRWHVITGISQVEPFKRKAHRDDEWTESPSIQFTTKHRKPGATWDDDLVDSGYRTDADAMIRKAWSAEDTKAKKDAALEFQASLTKTGKPRKTTEKEATR